MAFRNMLGSRAAVAGRQDDERRQRESDHAVDVPQRGHVLEVDYGELSWNMGDDD
jgi:hypothetical protein